MCPTILCFVFVHKVGNTFSGSRHLEIKEPRYRPMDIEWFPFLNTSGIVGLNQDKRL